MRIRRIHVFPLKTTTEESGEGARGGWIEKLESSHAEVIGSLERRRSRINSMQKSLIKQRDQNPPGLADKLTNIADLVVSHMHNWTHTKKVHKMDQILSCKSFEDDDAEIDVTIPAGFSPQEHAKRLYSRAKKVRRTQGVLEQLNVDVMKQYDEVDELQLRLGVIMNSAQCEDMTDLHEQQVHIDTHIALLQALQDVIEPPKQVVKKNKQARKGKEKFLVLILPSDGEEHEQLISLAVGRSSRENEHISFKMAQKHHLWFHVRDQPGSHCLLRLEPGQIATQDALNFAADVASYQSKAKGNGKVDVMYCKPENLKKPKGGRQGTVMVSKQEGNVIGFPDKGKLWIEKYRR